MLTRAYVYYKGPKGRVRLTAKGHWRRNGPSLKSAKREREPWLLVSNLPPRHRIEKRVVQIYRDRMAIEEAFRDLKAYRHGFAFRLNLGRNAERVANLLLIAALATLAVWLTGLIGIERGIARSLQANTERNRRVLSTFFIGIRVLNLSPRLRGEELQTAFHRLRSFIAERTLGFAQI
jgi:hypothetical protein